LILCIGSGLGGLVLSSPSVNPTGSINGTAFVNGGMKLSGELWTSGLITGSIISASSSINFNGNTLTNCVMTSPTLNTPTISTPTCSGGTFSSPSINSPTITGGTFSSPTVNGGTFTNPSLSSPTVNGGTFTNANITDSSNNVNSNRIVYNGSYYSNSGLTLAPTNGVNAATGMAINNLPAGNYIVSWKALSSCTVSTVVVTWTIYIRTSIVSGSAYLYQQAFTQQMQANDYYITGVPANRKISIYYATSDNTNSIYVTCRSLVLIPST